jgi:hydrogenase maturation protease
MNFEPVARIADAVLYEGYLLYPYRSTAVKNQLRFTFGCLLPPAFPQPGTSTEGSFLQTECLLLGTRRTELVIQSRFLHLTTRRSPSAPPWREAMPREAVPPSWNLDELVSHPQLHRFAFPSDHQEDGQVVRTRRAIEGAIEANAQDLGGGAFKVGVRLSNLTPFNPAEGRTRDEALEWSLVCCHLLLGAVGGEFLSLLDPPTTWHDAAASCRNIGVYPVLAGDPSQRDTVLAAPIILYDYPQIAAASPGDLFDSTEIDEMLTLRIQTLTEQEKREMSMLEPRAEQLLARCETLSPAQMLGMHGVLNGPADHLQPGMRVILHPRGSSDAFDLALAGKTAVIVSIEEDLERQIYVSVAVDDDPGQDLGLTGKPGHRFYFRPDEVEIVESRPGQGEKQSQGVLVAGVGNIFFGDDAFGVEVVRRLAERSFPADIVIKDVGIRGFDLACAMQDGYDTVILVDAVGRGSQPGTLHVLELDPETAQLPGQPEMHHLDPPQVFKLVRHMGGRFPRVLLVGCEPATLEPAADLSEPASHAVTKAIAVIQSLIAERSHAHADRQDNV